MPIDYASYQQGVVPAFQQAAAGYQTGAGIVRQQQQAQQKQAALQAQQQQATQMRSDLSALAANPNPTAKDYSEIMVKYPTMSEHFKRSFDVLTTGQKEASQTHALNLFSALDAGQTDVAKKLLEDQKLAAENSGLQKEADSAAAMLHLVENNPDAAKTSAGLLLSSAMGAEKFADTWTKLQTERKERDLQPGVLLKQGADLGLTKAQAGKVIAETKKLDVESQKAVIELEALKKTGGIDTEKKFTQEEKLRKEYTKRIAGFTESERLYDNIKASAGSGGPGDVALITSFMKMLDPGSVVRETEFATARDTAGLLAALTNKLQKAKTGEFLGEAQRKTFVNLAGKYFTAARKQQQNVKTDLSKVVENYNLDKENVFGVERETVTPAAIPEAISGRSYLRFSKPAGQ